MQQALLQCGAQRQQLSSFNGKTPNQIAHPFCGEYQFNTLKFSE